MDRDVFIQITETTRFPHSLMIPCYMQSVQIATIQSLFTEPITTQVTKCAITILKVVEEYLLE